VTEDLRRGDIVINPSAHGLLGKSLFLVMELSGEARFSRTEGFTFSQAKIALLTARAGQGWHGSVDPRYLRKVDHLPKLWPDRFGNFSPEALLLLQNAMVVAFETYQVVIDSDHMYLPDFTGERLQKL